MSTSSFLPPPGTNWIEALRPAVTFMLIGATMGSVMVVMLLALLFFSTPSLRKTPIFLLNVIVILLGLCGAIINIYEEVRSTLYPNVRENPTVIIAMGAVDGITPTLADSILLLRVWALFPLQTTPPLLMAFIFGVPVFLKIARFINATIYLAAYARDVQAWTAAQGGSILVTSSLPSVKIEWFLQVFDNAISSSVFLLQLRKRKTFKASSTFKQKLSTLFWIATSNFVFPVVMGIIQLTIYMATGNYLLALYIEEVNFHFTIIGVVFATVWAAELRWASTRGYHDYEAHGTSVPIDSARFPPASTIVFANRSSELSTSGNRERTNSVSSQSFEVAEMNQPDLKRAGSLILPKVSSTGVH
ncbi:hypothetical protein VKT23_011821 [Stygiomarasmius scandens]|uniref:Pheromone receptor n=1 Tax=Marasmiellus scandens TaxID=2682957 RepID=A0ABR1JCS2_9AGAR